MSSWFSFWGGENKTDTSSLETTLGTASKVENAIAKAEIAKSTMGAVEGLTSLANIPLYSKERKNAIKSIENQVLAGQEQIFRELSYNTDQAIVYAARGNVSIGAPVMRERMKKGAEEAGFDFAMLRANAKVAKADANIAYNQKRRAAFGNALKGVMGAMMTYGAFSGMGATGMAVDPMQQASAQNLLQ